GAPAGTAVGGRDEPDVELAGRRGAVARGVEVVRQADPGGGTRRAAVHADTRLEVVDRARRRVDRYAGRCAPRGPVRRLRDDDVVGRATGAEPAVRPGDVRGARRVDLGRRQRAGPQVTRLPVVVDRRHQDTRGPARAAVGGPERADLSRAGLVRHDHGAVRPDHGLAASSTARERIPSDEMSQTLCLASGAAGASLAALYLPPVLVVSPGNDPCAQVVPPFFDGAQPVSDDPPPDTRPIWNAPTIVLP